MLNEKICPYPGLRPFSEDESIFFKGREEHIKQIISQLEEKKFVMLTGASGDGKSSLVYAGVIPNARAGFFKAQHNSWSIVNFRPERSPLENLASNLAVNLQMADEKLLEIELNSGYSALVNAYKKSPLYVDLNSEKFKSAGDAEKKNLKRRANNLFILVDQFEEFFTNTENFNQGRPSLPAQLVVNLLLETAKIALLENLPIYIICTMRSDYIGQCASFRGLPEYIGFSQFFVPRLNRMQLTQVIEEPAMLSGNKIAKRLSELLINEVNDSIDQLPVLQHTLKRVWQMADAEDAEMDLIHFAKLCGMPSRQLPTGDQEKFNSWFNTLPEFKKAYFKNPSLANVLDAHANELLETANIYHEKHTGIPISKKDAELILSRVFKCLTKIDENRAVRNRMSLQEITEVINDSSFSINTVIALINVFREQHSTFVRPFITSDPESKTLKMDAVLDITHESFIRNWGVLTVWARDERENLTNFQDLNKQLERWLRSKRSRSYLLPKGPLTFFETWYASATINPNWLLKYDERELDRKTKYKEASEKISDTRAFLSRSRRVFKIKNWIVAGSIIWALFWISFMWYKASKEAMVEGAKAKTERSKAEKLATEVLFNRLSPRVVAPSSYILLGDEYVADIFIAASSTALDQKILIGKLDSADNITNVTDTIPIGKGGVGTYTRLAEQPGLHAYEGVIQVKNPNGQVQNYPFSQEYMVGRTSISVSADMLNVMYAGVNNPVSVGASGIAPADLSVTVDPGKVDQISPGHYNMSFMTHGLVSISVEARLKDGKYRPLGPPMKFRVKPIPDPSAFVGNVTGSAKMTKADLLRCSHLEMKVVGFDFVVKSTVQSFSLLLLSGGNTTKRATQKTGTFNNEALGILKQTKKGDLIIFDQISIQMSDSTKRNISPVSIEIL